MYGAMALNKIGICLETTTGMYISQKTDAFTERQLIRMLVSSALIAFAAAFHMICTGGMSSNITAVLVIVYCLSPMAGVFGSIGKISVELLFSPFNMFYQ